MFQADPQAVYDEVYIKKTPDGKKMIKQQNHNTMYSQVNFQNKPQSDTDSDWEYFT